MKIEERVLNWLLEENQPVVRYYTLLNLLKRKESDHEVRSAHSSITRRGWAHDILKVQKPSGYWESIKSLYRPKYLSTNWRMLVLSDFALTKEDRRIRLGCELYFDKWMQPKDNVLDEREVCVVGNLARALTRFGYADDPRVKKLFDWLVDNQKDDGGWHCFKSDNGTLDCWEALAAYASLARRKWTRRLKNSVERGAEFYLKLNLFKEGSRRYDPWFRFHYPVHYYYDILVGLNTITSLGYADDKRLVPALRIMLEKRRPDGTWILDAIHPDIGRGAGYKLRKPLPIPFALEKKDEPSKWITLTALLVLKRVEEAGLKTDGL